MTSLDALYGGPVVTVRAPPLGDARGVALRAWHMRGTPSKRGAARYDSRTAGGGKLDFCHEYFGGRGLDALCDMGGAEGWSRPVWR